MKERKEWKKEITRRKKELKKERQVKNKKKRLLNIELGWYMHSTKDGENVIAWCIGVQTCPNKER